MYTECGCKLKPTMKINLFKCTMLSVVVTNFMTINVPGGLWCELCTLVVNHICKFFLLNWEIVTCVFMVVYTCVYQFLWRNLMI